MKNFHSGNINLIIKIFIWQVMEQGSSNLYQQPIHAQKKARMLHLQTWVMRSVLIVSV